MSEDNIEALVTLESRFPTCPKESNSDFVRSPSWVADAIKDGIEKRLIPKPPASVIDLGCGNGYVVALFAALGYDAFGIEIQQPLIEHAEKAAKELSSLPGKMHFACGNYLPQNVRKLAVPQGRVILQDAPKKYTMPYEALKKKHLEFDIFFVYPFPNQMDTVFDFFGRYPRSGAHLIIVGDEIDWRPQREPGKNLVHSGTQQLSSAPCQGASQRSYCVYRKQ